MEIKKEAFHSMAQVLKDTPISVPKRTPKKSTRSQAEIQAYHNKLKNNATKKKKRKKRK